MYIWSIISVILIFTILGFINRRITKSKNGNVIKMTRIFMLIGIIVILILILFNIDSALNYNKEDAIAPLYKEEIPLLIFADIIFFSASIFLIMTYFNHRIYYNEKGFIYKNKLGWKKRYSYDDIQWYTYSDSYFGTTGMPLGQFETESSSSKRFRDSLKFATLELGIDDKKIEFALCSGIPNFIEHIKKYKNQ